MRRPSTSRQKKFFDAPEWAGITDWADELAPHIDQARRMLGVVPVPYMDTQMDRLMREVAGEMGRGETYNKAPVGVYFGTPGVEADDPYFGGSPVDRGAQSYRIGTFHRRDHDRRVCRPGGCRSLPAGIRLPASARDGGQCDARQSRRESHTDDHCAGGARDVVLAQQGRHRSARRARLGLPAGQGGHAAQAHSPEVRTGRATTTSTKATRCRGAYSLARR